MAITAADVNKLRQMTGAGMMDCKKALTEANGDFEAAIDVLRKQGQNLAAKRADRDATEGAVIAMTNADQTRGVVISLNCETDFVAKNEGYVAMATKMAEVALAGAPPDPPAPVDDQSRGCRQTVAGSPSRSSCLSSGSCCRRRRTCLRLLRPPDAGALLA